MSHGAETMARIEPMRMGTANGHVICVEIKQPQKNDIHSFAFFTALIVVTTLCKEAKEITNHVPLPEWRAVTLELPDEECHHPIQPKRKPL